ncbi:hypothetical protein D3C80_626170 [compost metagenome]
MTGIERDDETDHRTKQHHAFLAQVEDAAFLADQFPQRHQQQRCTAADHGVENIAQQIDIHHIAPVCTTVDCARRAQRRFKRGR